MRALTSPLVIVTMVAITAASVAAVPLANAAASDTGRTSSDTVLLQGATEATVSLRLDTGQIWLAGGSMASGTVVSQAELLRGSFELEGGEEPAITYELTEDGREGRLVIEPAETDELWSWSSHEQRWRLYLNPTIPTRLFLELGHGDAELVIGGTMLTELQIDAGSGNLTLDLTGDWRRSLRGQIGIGAGDVTIRAPRDTGVRVTAEQGVGTVRGQGFSPRDGAHVNAAFGTTIHQIELHIEQGAGFIDLGEP
jgi:hypothetical protein